MCGLLCLRHRHMAIVEGHARPCTTERVSARRRVHRVYFTLEELQRVQRQPHPTLVIQIKIIQLSRQHQKS